MRTLERPQVVAVAGEVDHYRAPAFRKELWSAARGGNVIVDLSQTTFMDSTTLGVLLDAHKRLSPQGGALTLVCNDRNLLRLFEITALDRLFPIYSTLAEAIAGTDQVRFAPWEALRGNGA